MAYYYPTEYVPLAVDLAAKFPKLDPLVKMAHSVKPPYIPNGQAHSTSTSSKSLLAAPPFACAPSATGSDLAVASITGEIKSAATSENDVDESPIAGALVVAGEQPLTAVAIFQPTKGPGRKTWVRYYENGREILQARRM
ncbi:hypothetical protein FRB96_006199 [Tulasnella sp. 330]|nr:hypothetical protein FRB96_006199 [Tulasnella sp. 330]KAG8877229.1 hypothetical protein FRB97_003579 [Tulasnella sp. 331]KAG8887080.1 hypothetical protein FRB98_000607 [Tulasnella sp. 332]